MTTMPLRAASKAPGFLFLLLILPLLSACGYNTIPTAEENAKAAWSEVLNQYQRRADLIPNLVETVKGYASHERQTLEAVVAARDAAVAAQGPAAPGSRTWSSAAPPCRAIRWPRSCSTARST